jgi:hypothetical protein
MAGTIVHDLKCWPEPYDALASGLKTFEIRKNDRGYKVGHYLRLNRWDPKTESYTGPFHIVRVTYIGGSEFLPEAAAGHVVMAVVEATYAEGCMVLRYIANRQRVARDAEKADKP